MKIKWLWIVGICLGVTISWANIITDPSGLNTSINSNELIMQEEVGNISLAGFNALSLRYAITFEEDDGYTSGATVTRVEFTETESGIELDVGFARDGGNYMLVSDFRPTGGANDLVLGSVNASLDLTFSSAMQGVAFTANRIEGGALTVQLFSDESMNTQIGSDYTIAVNTGGELSERSFFGFFDPQTDIRAVRIDGSAANQYSIDDLNVAIPEPSALGLVVLGVSALLACRRRPWRS